MTETQLSTSKRLRKVKHAWADGVRKRPTQVLSQDGKWHYTRHNIGHHEVVIGLMPGEVRDYDQTLTAFYRNLIALSCLDKVQVILSPNHAVGLAEYLIMAKKAGEAGKIAAQPKPEDTPKQNRKGAKAAGSPDAERLADIADRLADNREASEAVPDAAETAAVEAPTTLFWV